MAVGCLMGIPIDQNKLILSFLSFSATLIILFALKRFRFSTKVKLSLIYLHLTTLFFPFVLFTTNVGCGVLCMSCYGSLMKLVVYTLPTTLLLSTVAGFFVIPTFYVMTNKRREIRDKGILRFVRRYSRKMNIDVPKLYAVDKANPIAFSFRSFKSAIFMSVGLLDILNKREIEAILLHEIAHIKNNSSALKVSSSVMRIFSPLSVLARFNHDSNEEEKVADRFVVKIQKTTRHLSSAKKKMDKFLGR